MRYLLALPALYLAGFLWQLGRDSAESVRIQTTRKARARRRDQVMEAVRREEDALAEQWLAERRAGRRRNGEKGEPVVYYIGNAQAAPGTVQ